MKGFESKIPAEFDILPADTPRAETKTVDNAPCSAILVLAFCSLLQNLVAPRAGYFRNGAGLFIVCSPPIIPFFASVYSWSKEKNGDFHSIL